MNIIEIIAQDIFDKVRGRFANLQMGNEDGTVTSNPKEARFFDFDFVLEGNNLGRVSVSINERGTLKIFYSQGITEGQDHITRGLWYDFLKEMRFFAKRRMLRFDTRDIAKGNLDKSDFQYLAINGSKEDNMNESSMYGSSKTSYRKLENTRLIVRHGKAVDEGKAGDRSRHISALFVENAEGERFKYPFIHLAGAKCMQRHVANGGYPHDDAGKAIIKMSEQIAQLNSFKRHVKTATLNDDAHQIHQRAGQKLQSLRDCMDRLQTQRGYQEWMECFTPMEEAAELDPVTMEDYKAKFTVKHFDETLEGIFPLIHSIMKETGTLDLEDMVSEGEECSVCHKDPCECDDEEESVKEDSFDAFEGWADSIVEGTMTPDQLAQLKDLLDSGAFTLGPDGTSAIEALQGVGIEDEGLEKALEALANVDPSADPMDTLAAWLKVNDPEALQQLVGGNEPPEAPAPTNAPQGDMGPDANAGAEAPVPDDGAGLPQAGAPEEVPAEQPTAEDTNTQHVPIGQQMANDGITYSREKEREIIDLMAQYMKKNGMSPKSIRYYLNYDEDYIPDQLSYLPREKAPEEGEDMDNAEPTGTQPVNIKELAEFIGAFYNPHGREQGLGEWRKGPTELGIMAGKQFGEKAGRMVELMVKKMQERSQGHQEFAEVMKLAGVKTAESGPNKSEVPAFLRKKKGEKPLTKQELDAEPEKNISHPKALAKNSGRANEEFDVIMKLAGMAK
jgi:hypothetical protein